uniref:Saccharopine dehydrogenase n=1 Tax=Caulobacter sp. (strain K31) TaxID=366602 RepID=B0T6N1_CAUSK
MTERDFDVVIYGATGFTGRQAVEYFRRHAPANLKWAIAGRDNERLAALEAGVPIVTVEPQQQDSIDDLVRRTRVVLSTAGPFRLYSDRVVDACVRLGADYTDISGETARIRDLIDRHHARAVSNRVRIVPFCGVSSAPADLALMLLNAKLGDLVVAKGAYSVAGGTLNGGTIASISYAISSGDAARERDVFLLGPHDRPPGPIERDPKQIHFDGDLRVWTAPSPMGLSDTRAVRRSNVLQGRDFAYQEYMAFESFFGALGFAMMIRVLNAVLAFAPTRRWLQKKFPPGHGPSQQVMDGGSITLRAWGRTQAGREAEVAVHAKGDPGNRVTVMCVCEAALALAADTRALPDAFGVLTPSVALGDVMLKRLQARGVQIS